MSSSGSEEVDLKWLESRVEGRYGVTSLESCTMEPAVAEGENYISQIYRLAVRGRSDGGGPDRTLSIILKRKVDMDIEENVRQKIEEAFTVEYRVYERILSPIGRYLPREQALWADYLGTYQDTDIYFEDLKVSGYRLASRQDGLDYDHCLLVMGCLGELHAASCVAVERREVDVGPYTRYLMLGSASPEHRLKTSEFQVMADVILNDWGPEWEPMAERLCKLKNTLEDMAFDSGVFDEKRFNVFCHGDTWVNNFMFKYDSTSRPIALKFVDFQIAHYNSPGFDLVYLLNSSVHPDLKRRHLGTFVDVYCRAFDRTLSAAGSPGPRPAPDLVLAEIDRLAPFGLLVSLRIRPIIMAPPEHRVTIPEMMANPGVTPKRRRVYANPKYVQVMKSDLPHLLSLIESSTR